jgi:hypothetical protein
VTEMTPLKSSNVAAAGWDHDGAEPDAEGQRFGTLTVRFASGAEYRYAGVPESAFEGLRDATSHGSYFHERIRGFYRGEKADDKEETP